MHEKRGGQEARVKKRVREIRAGTIGGGGVGGRLGHLGKVTLEKSGVAASVTSGD